MSREDKDEDVLDNIMKEYFVLKLKYAKKFMVLL